MKKVKSLFFTGLGAFLLASESLMGASCDPIPSRGPLSADEVSGSRYRKVSLLGRPLPDEKPQAKEETDYINEETYVDAMTTQLTHITTDIYIPVPSTELVLEVRRSASSDGHTEPAFVNDRKKPNQFPDRIFSFCWGASSLTPHLIRVKDSATVTVMDESGGQYKFKSFLNMAPGEGNSKIGYWPIITNPTGKEAIGTSLSRTSNNRYVLKKRHGTELTYASNGVLIADGATIMRYHRLLEVKDKYGNRLVYTYPNNGTICPNKIEVKYSNGVTGPALLITQSSGRVTSIQDPNGNTVTYEYQDDYLHKVKKSPGGSEVSETEYTYDDHHEVVGPINVYHWNITEIKDPKGNVYGFEWDYPITPGHFEPGDLHFQYAIPFVVKKVIHPNSNEVTFDQSVYGWPLPFNDVVIDDVEALKYKRATKIVDAKGNAVLYLFDQLKQWDADGADGIMDDGSLFHYRHTQIRYFEGSDFTIAFDSSGVEDLDINPGTALLGDEEFFFKVTANLALEKSIDFSNNETEWEYNDEWNHTEYFTWNLDPMFSLALTFNYEDPTKEINALDKVKEFEYDSKYRLMTKIKDALGRTTEYTIDSLGRRTRESVKDPSGNAIQDTVFEYHSSLKGFMTKKTVKKLTGAGDPSWVVDLVTEYVPDSKGRLVKEIVDPAGLELTTEYSYDNNNNKVSTKDPRDEVTTMTYDGMNRLKKVTYPAVAPATVGAFKEFFYDLRSNKIREMDENGNSTLFAYDAMNRLIKQARDMNDNGEIDSADLVTESTYDGLGSKLTQKDPNGNLATMEYDALQRLVKTTAPAPLNYVTTFEYGTNSGGSVFDVSGFKPTKSTDPRGVETKVTYDALYRPIKKEVEYSTDIFAVTDMTYDDVGNINSQKVYKDAGDTVGITTEFEYDHLNRQILVRNVAGSLTEESLVETDYTSTGLKYRVVDENGHDALGNRIAGRDQLTEYDAAGRPEYTISQVVAWAGTVPTPSRAPGTGLARSVTQTVYDAAGNVIKTINPLGKEWEFTFDERNRKTKEKQPEVFDAVTNANAHPEIKSEYDAAGRVVKVIDAKGNETETEYDRANRVVKVIAPEVALPGGGTGHPETVTVYDKNGNVLTLTDANGHVTTNTYDELNRLKTTTDAEGIVVANEYDSAGNKTAVITNPSLGGYQGQRTELTYDGLNRNLSIKDPANKTQSFFYNALVKTGRLDAMGVRTGYSYDGRLRLLQVGYWTGATNSSDGTPENTSTNATRTYTYDLRGNLLGVAEPTKGGVADVAYSYDNLNRMVAETSSGFMHAYSYDLAGNRLVAVYGGGKTLVSTYDDLNRLSTLTEGVALTTYQYDLNGNKAKLTLPNGDLTTSTHDALNRVSVIETKTGGTTLLSKYSQTYDKVGNVVKIEEDYASGGLVDRMVSNVYDDINRLVEESATSGASTVTTSFDYDKVHNRTSKVVTGGAGAGTSSYSYNNLNQLVSYITPSDSYTLTYDDNGNRTLLDGSGDVYYSYDFENRLSNVYLAGGASYQYSYDYRTRRVSTMQYGSASFEIRKIVFSGGTSVIEWVLGSPDTIAVENIRGSDYGGGVGGILYTIRGGVPSYTHYNNRGDVVAKTAANGALTYQASYEAYGTRTAEQGSTQDRQKANTKDEDPTGLLNEGFRYRDLETGTFITRDPLGFVDGPNMYAYVVQNPWTKFDPEGLSEAEVNEALANGLEMTPTPIRLMAQLVGADKALQSALVKADAKATSKEGLSGMDKAMLTLEGSAPAITAAVLAPAAAAGPAVFAKETIAETLGLPIGFDDIGKLLRGSDDLFKSAKDIVTLEHGTTLDRANNIAKNGPDVNFIEPQGYSADGFSTALPEGPFPVGSPTDYAKDKASIFPNEGGPAILEMQMPKSVANFGSDLGGAEIRFNKDGTEALKFNWDQVKTKVKKVDPQPGVKKKAKKQ